MKALEAIDCCGSSALYEPYEVKEAGASPHPLFVVLIRSCEVVEAHDQVPTRRGPSQPESHPV
jgi:hypothetical protein